MNTADLMGREKMQTSISADNPLEHGLSHYQGEPAILIVADTLRSPVQHA
jgi:hypothetical protein